jgi:hypothetical protein
MIEPKYLILNGLPRSGTTMHSRIIGSQPDMICSGGLFEMTNIVVNILPHSKIAVNSALLFICHVGRDIIPWFKKILRTH